MKTRLNIAENIESMSLVTGQRSLVNDSIQIALNRISQAHDWPYYMKEGVINTVAPYETGTVTVSNGSTTVTGSGTTFTSAMVGRKIRINNEPAYYRIASFSSTTSISLETPYQGSLTSGNTYIIYKDTYRLNADVDKTKKFVQIANGICLGDANPSAFDEVFPTPQSYASPYIQFIIGTRLDTYSTGTVSASGTTITGSSTAWTSVEGLGRMSSIRIGNNVYTVKSVDSATQITTFEALTTATAGTAYEITLRNIVVQFYSIPDSQENIYYRYFRLPDVLANDYDIPDMPSGYEFILMYGGLSIMYMHKGDMQKSQIESEARFIDGINLMKQKIGSFSADRKYKRKSIDRSYGIGDILEGPAFDRRWSSPR